MKLKPIIRSLDLGWGYAKYSKINEVGEIEYNSFPSLAPRASSQEMSMGLLGKRDTVVVDVEGTEYEVGPDSYDLDSSDATRNLNDNYIVTDQYKAVFYGALHYINEDVIDLLVVGLPVSGMYNIDKLKELTIGEHQITKFKKVTVKNVLVLPQPLGGLYYCMSRKDIEELEYMKEEYNLIIDPGFLTFDFLLANGNRLIENRSNAHAGGVSKILRSIAKSISEKFNIKYENLSAIDKGLKRKKMKINGEIEPLLEHIKNTKSVIEGSVNYMKNIIGDGSDIDNIILIGGGSDVFKKTIETYYPKHKIISIENPQLANVMGFQEAGEEYFDGLVEDVKENILVKNESNKKEAAKKIEEVQDENKESI